MINNKEHSEIYLNTDKKNNLEIYLNEADKYRISVEEQKEIGKKILEEGMTPEYRDVLVKSQLFFVFSIAKNYQNKGMELIDLIQEGNIGLMKAIDKYDPSIGTLSTYSVNWIKESIYKALGENAYGIRIPLKKREILSKVKVYRSEGYSIEKISKILSKTKKELNSLLEIGKTVLSLDYPILEDNTSLVDNIGTNYYSPTKDIDRLKSSSGVSDIEKIINSSLNEREADIIKERFGINSEENEKTFQEIGKKYNLTKQRIEQIQKKALKKLFQNPAIKELKYLYK